jgi:hypothetical protein
MIMDAVTLAANLIWFIIFAEWLAFFGSSNDQEIAAISRRNSMAGDSPQWILMPQH